MRDASLIIGAKKSRQKKLAGMMLVFVTGLTGLTMIGLTSAASIANAADVGQSVWAEKSTASADESVLLASAEQGWALQFMTPALIDREESSSASRYRFFGKSRDGFFLSLHVEPLPGGEISSGSCWAKYHAGGLNLPDIVDKQSVSTIAGDVFEVHYQARIQFRGQELAMPNTHYYFMLNGHCADLHMAATPVYDQKSGRTYPAVATLVKDSLVRNTLAANELKESELKESELIKNELAKSAPARTNTLAMERIAQY
jgi:hypothetical protein